MRYLADSRNLPYGEKTSAWLEARMQRMTEVLLDGGIGTDTLRVAASFTSSSNAQIANIENVVMTVAGTTLDLTNQTEAFNITGSGGSDANTTDGIADTRGADGAAVSAVRFGEAAGAVGGSTAGAYGTLVLNADGSYTYTLNNGLAAVQGLDSNDTLTEVFTYTLRDGDGDTSTATLKIIINGADDKITIDGLSAQGPDLTVYEDDLADGSSPNAAALTQTGQFTVNGVDGIASIKIEGVNAFVGQTFTTAHGVFIITGISAPVWQPGGVLAGALTLTLPEARMKARYAADVRAAAAELTARLGGNPPAPKASARP